MIVTEIRCDICGSGVSISRRNGRYHAHMLRQMLKENGWTCIEAGGKDYCPKCKSANRETMFCDCCHEEVTSNWNDDCGSYICPICGDHITG